MEQHPVPQYIASFEFKLFGNLTVRQFVTLAIPMSLAAAIYFSGLPAVLRYLFAGAVALFALFAALVPINGRPFDKWVVSFIKAVLSPTQRVWVKETKIPEFLNVVVAATSTEEHIPDSITAQGRERLKAYLRSLPKGNLNTLDVREQIAISHLGLVAEAPVVSTAASGGKMTGIDGGKLAPPIIWPTQGAQPLYAKASVPQVTQEGIPPISTPAVETPYEGMPASSGEYVAQMEASLPVIEPYHQRAAPTINQHAKAYALSGLDKRLRKEHARRAEAVELATQVPPTVKAQLASEANFTVESVIPIRTPDRKIKLIHGVSGTRARKLHFGPPEGFDLSKLPIRGERRFEISDELKKRFATNIEDLFKEKKAVPVQGAQVPAEHITSRAAVGHRSIVRPNVNTKAASDLTLKQEKSEDLGARILIKGKKLPTLTSSDKLALAQMVPLTNVPNVLSGIVVKQDGSPVEGVILVIRDQQGIPVRALKTNKLGQFLSATPLSSGDYTVEIDATTANFKPFTLSLNGKVMEPIEVMAES